MFLSLSQAMGFFTLLSPLVLLRNMSEREAWWDSGSQPRLSHQNYTASKSCKQMTQIISHMAVIVVITGTLRNYVALAATWKHTHKTFNGQSCLKEDSRIFHDE